MNSINFFNDSRLTLHAKERMQERGISALDLQLLELFGDEEKTTKDDIIKLKMKGNIIDKIERALKKLRFIEAIKSKNGAVITAYNNYRNEKKKRKKANKKMRYFKL